MPNCSVCKVFVNNKQWTSHLRSNVHKSNSTTLLDDNVAIINTSFKERIISYKIMAINEQINNFPELFLNNLSEQVKNLIDRALQKHIAIKINFELFSFFLLCKNDQQEIKSFATKNQIVYSNYDFNSIYTTSIVTLLKKVEEFQERDSGWTFLCNSHLEININKYQPLGGSKFFTLPKYIKNKKACLNIRNQVEYCFLWCIVAALHPTTRHPDRVSSYPHFQNVLNVHGLKFPISFSDIAIFEKNNPFLNIFVYGLKNDKTIIGLCTKQRIINQRAFIYCF